MSGKRARSERYEERKATLPNKKVIRLISRAERNIDAAYAKPPPQYVLNPPSLSLADAMDIAEGERAATMQALGYRNASLQSASFAPSSATSYRRLARNYRKPASSYRASLAKKASKASLARARTSAKKGGMAASKKTLIKAANRGTYLIHYRGLMKLSKAKLLNAMKLESKSVLAACLAKRYTK